MSKVKQSHDFADWSAQSYLCRKLIQEMRANNVNRVIVITEDNGGQIFSSVHNANGKKLQKLISSFWEQV